MIAVSPVWVGTLPMAEPSFRPDGLITYACPLGCHWHFSMDTPPLEKLDLHVRMSRKMISDHYRKSHGVTDEE